MSNHVKWPMVLPFKAHRDVGSPGIHFDDNWAKKQIKNWERPAFYQQKWQKLEKTKIQIESSLAPNNLQYLNSAAQVVKSTAWVQVFTTLNYSIWEVEVDFTDIAKQVYFLYSRIQFGGIDWAFITEPINVQDEWPNTLLFEYTNSFNDFDVAWTVTKPIFRFRCEAAIPAQETAFKRGATDYVDQNVDVELLRAYPNRVYQLHIGGTSSDAGVAPWVLDLINRIFCCDTVWVATKRMAANSGVDLKPEVVKGYPLLTATLELAASANDSSVEFEDLTEVGKGIVIAYEFETGFFGAGASVPIIDVEKNS